MDNSLFDAIYSYAEKNVNDFNIANEPNNSSIVKNYEKVIKFLGFPYVVFKRYDELFDYDSYGILISCSGVIFIVVDEFETPEILLYNNETDKFVYDVNKGITMSDSLLEYVHENLLDFIITNQKFDSNQLNNSPKNSEPEEFSFIVTEENCHVLTPMNNFYDYTVETSYNNYQIRFCCLQFSKGMIYNKFNLYGYDYIAKDFIYTGEIVTRQMELDWTTSTNLIRFFKKHDKIVQRTLCSVFYYNSLWKIIEQGCISIDDGIILKLDYVNAITMNPFSRVIIDQYYLIVLDETCAYEIVHLGSCSYDNHPIQLWNINECSRCNTVISDVYRNRGNILNKRVKLLFPDGSSLNRLLTTGKKDSIPKLLHDPVYIQYVE